MFIGGATDVDFNRARKAHGRPIESYGISAKIGRDPIIYFGPKDMVEVTIPHTDALVFQATIVNYEVTWEFVDIGSLENIIFRDAFNQIHVDLIELHYTFTALFGFTSHQIQRLGQILLPLSLGEESCR